MSSPEDSESELQLGDVPSSGSDSGGELPIDDVPLIPEPAVEPPPLPPPASPPPHVEIAPPPPAAEVGCTQMVPRLDGPQPSSFSVIGWPQRGRGSARGKGRPRKECILNPLAIISSRPAAPEVQAAEASATDPALQVALAEAGLHAAAWASESASSTELCRLATAPHIVEGPGPSQILNGFALYVNQMAEHLHQAWH